MPTDAYTTWLAEVRRVAALRAMQQCHARRDGTCWTTHCPQRRDGEPQRSGRPCPLPHWLEED